MTDPEANEFGTADVFLDDIFSVIPQLDGDSPGDRGAQAALLALDVLGRPLHPDGAKSLPRDKNLAIDKAIAEGTPAERLIVLGWMIDTQRLLISLPTDKFTAWTAEMKDLVLWKDFLVVAHTGIDLNLLTTREPNNILRTDACEHGLGGYSLKTGRAWRWEIPFASTRAQVDQLPRVPGLRGRDYAQHRGG